MKTISRNLTYSGNFVEGAGLARGINFSSWVGVNGICGAGSWKIEDCGIVKRWRREEVSLFRSYENNWSDKCVCF